MNTNRRTLEIQALLMIGHDRKDRSCTHKAPVRKIAETPTLPALEDL